MYEYIPKAFAATAHLLSSVLLSGRSQSVRLLSHEAEHSRTLCATRAAD